MDEIEIPARGVCPKCQSADIEIPAGHGPDTIVTCPNCGFQCRFSDLFEDEGHESE